MIIDGFSYAAVAAGIRKKDRLDLGLIFCAAPATAAGIFTTNRVQAAPVLLDRQRLTGRAAAIPGLPDTGPSMAGGQAQAILINSGIANACTGEPGMVAALACGKLAAEALGIDEELVQVASTGVIGEQLDVSRFAQAMPGLCGGLTADGYDRVARAMMTTDTVPKTASQQVAVAGHDVKIFGMAKGAGMIMPNMATMLCFVVTDAAIAADVLQDMLRRGVDQSFNRITVDGDTSTNDTVLLLASGRAGNPAITVAGSPEGRAFSGALDALLRDMARQIVKDGEGATKLVTIRVNGAPDEAVAEQAARTIANSALVKTAFFGEDANWGRIIAALGRAGIEFDQNRVDIAFDDVLMVRDGLGQGKAAEAMATAVLKKKEFSVNVDLKAGPVGCEVLTCDFSMDYVKINADYRS